MKLSQILTLSFTLLALSPAFADKMMSSQKEIANLAAVLESVKAQTEIPVVFPTQVPKNPTLKQLYAYVDLSQIGKTFYTISIDSSSTCHGARYCSVGSLQVSTDGQPATYKDMDNQDITQAINLTPTQKAFYTPGHAMADYWPPTLEWRDANYFYQLIWQVRNQSALVATAKSIQPVQ